MRGADIDHPRPRGLDPAQREAGGARGAAQAAASVGQAGAEVAVRINRQLELAVPDIAAAIMPRSAR
jgi:citrate lyase subunit beta / citryl-CoA lyase